MVLSSNEFEVYKSLIHPKMKDTVHSRAKDTSETQGRKFIHSIFVNRCQNFAIVIPLNMKTPLLILPNFM